MAGRWLLKGMTVIQLCVRDLRTIPCLSLSLSRQRGLTSYKLADLTLVGSVGSTLEVLLCNRFARCSRVEEQ